MVSWVCFAPWRLPRPKGRCKVSAMPNQDEPDPAYLASLANDPEYAAARDEMRAAFKLDISSAETRAAFEQGKSAERQKVLNEYAALRSTGLLCTCGFDKQTAGTTPVWACPLYDEHLNRTQEDQRKRRASDPPSRVIAHDGLAPESLGAKYAREVVKLPPGVVEPVALGEALTLPIRKDKTIMDQIDQWFTYHAPSEDQQMRYEALRSKARELAITIVAMTPLSADQTAALRKLRECVATANAAIACEDK